MGAAAAAQGVVEARQALKDAVQATARQLAGLVGSVLQVKLPVPVLTRALSGVDSLYSIVQMPAGVPVATVAIDNATNAAFLAEHAALRMVAEQDIGDGPLAADIEIELDVVLEHFIDGEIGTEILTL